MTSLGPTTEELTFIIQRRSRRVRSTVRVRVRAGISCGRAAAGAHARRARWLDVLPSGWRRSSLLCCRVWSSAARVSTPPCSPNPPGTSRAECKCGHFHSVPRVSEACAKKKFRVALSLKLSGRLYIKFRHSHSDCRSVLTGLRSLSPIPDTLERNATAPKSQPHF